MTRSVFGISNGVIAAVVATMFHALAVVLQKAEAGRVTTHGLRILGSLAKRAVWLLAIAIQVACLGFHAFALTRAPVAVVQPIFAAGVLFVMLFAFLIGGIGLLVRELRGSSAIASVLPQDLGLALAAFATAVGLVTLCTSQRASGRSLG